MGQTDTIGQRCQDDIFPKISLHCVLSSRVANYKNDIQ